MGQSASAGPQSTRPRVGQVTAPFPDLTPVQREQLGAWMAAKGRAWEAALEAGRKWLRQHPDDETMQNQVAYWRNLVGAWKQAAYLVRVTGTKRPKKTGEGDNGGQGS